MYKKVIPYVDYNGVERTETAYFHLTQAELMKMEMGITGGFTQMIEKLIEARDVPQLMNVFEDMIQKSYGVKTPDGKGFSKKKENLEAFMETPAYSVLFMELATNTKAASDFVNGIMPDDLPKDNGNLSVVPAPNN
jgi:hypothetical protein